MTSARTGSLIPINALSLFIALGIATACSPGFGQSAGDALPRPKALQVAPGMSEEEANEVLLPALRYFAFWNTGEEKFADEALSPDFTDLNLPKGRPQGPTGPVAASKGFRKAVTDLQASAEAVWVNGDSVIARLHFTGHFTGTYGELKGRGQPIAFYAVDMYTVRDGKIVANWHLEDNLTFMQQLGAIPAQ